MKRQLSPSDFYVITYPLTEQERESLRPRVQERIQELRHMLEQLPERRWDLRFEDSEEINPKLAWDITRHLDKTIAEAWGLGNLHQEDYTSLIEVSVQNIDRFYKRFKFMIGAFKEYWKMFPHNSYLHDEADRVSLEQLISFVTDPQKISQLYEQFYEGIERVENHIDKFDRHR